MIQAKLAAVFASFRSLNPDDTFLFFVASHGTVDDGEYFLPTSNVDATSAQKLRSDALDGALRLDLVAGGAGRLLGPRPFLLRPRREPEREGGALPRRLRRTLSLANYVEDQVPVLAEQV
jgi:hypothetical protein